MYRSEAVTPERWQARDAPAESSQQISTDHNNKSKGSNGSVKSTTAMPLRITSRPTGIKRGDSLINDDPQSQQQNGEMEDRKQEVLEKSSLAQKLIFSRLETTGAHGIPNIQRAPNNFRKILWTSLFLFGVSMFIWQTSSLLTRYYMYDVNIKLAISNDRMLEFPAITVCNLNPIKEDFLEELRDGGVALPPSLTRPNKGFQDDPDSELDDRFEMLEDAVNLVAGLKYKRRRTAGHLLQDMLLRCVFLGRPCNVSDFRHFHHYLYGNCYIFNFASSANRRFVTKVGPLYGLTLELYIEQDQYVANIQSAAGARVVVHGHHDMPFPEDDGVSISPGQETFIGIKRTNYTRLIAPFSNCTAVSTSNKTIFNRPLPHVRYTQRACENDCYYQNLTRTCGCADVRYRYNDEIPLCFNKSQVSCMDSVVTMYLAGSLDCNCTSPCREVAYEVVTGQARWPNEKFKPELQEAFGNISEELEKDRDRDKDPNFLEKNVLKVNIYYDSLEYTTLSQEEAYDEVALLSDMGGNVGLWIGVSVLTVFEFIELFYDLGKLLFYRIFRKRIEKSARRQGKVTSSDIDLHHVTRFGTNDPGRNDYGGS